MEGLTPVNLVQFGTILLAALVHASLQLGLGALLLLYHASLGKHIKKKTKQLASNYILGVTLLTVLIVSTAAFIIGTITSSSLSVETLAIIVGILLMLAIIIWFFYYRTRRSTELWLPKSVARYIGTRAKLTESNTEAFSLGMLSSLAEIPFSIVLMILAGNSILGLPINLQIFAVLLYTFIAILPLFILRLSIRRGNTVVDVQKWRMKNKEFLKVMTGVGFMTLALFIIGFRILGG
ncbi:MAG: hypothetical protein Q4E70_00525 [Candidatus Saccharibacteria bacterium]|nr:hypothetical protein [Candidatus Saccharibacteria bacterium]